MTRTWWRKKANNDGTKRARRSYRPWLECLENRLAPATFNVARAADLSAAISAADTNSDSSNMINVAAGTYQVIEQMIQAPSGKALAIIGQDTGATLQSDGATNRVFEVNANVLFENLTISGGFATDGGQLGGTAALGGGILIDGGQVTLNTVTVSNNIAQGANGSDGTIGVAGAPGANAYGGGIYVAGGGLTLIDSQVQSNQAIAGNGGKTGFAINGDPIPGAGTGGNAYGGGIYLAQGDLTATASQVLENQAVAGSGGNGRTVAYQDSSGDSISPIPGNAGADGGNAFGGGIAAAPGSASLTLTSTEVYLNQAIAGNGGLGGNGGAGPDGAAGAGGGIGADGTAGESGLSGLPGGQGANGGAASGGGIYADGTTIQLTQGGVDSNLVQGGAGGAGGAGGRGGAGGQGGDGGQGVQGDDPGGSGSNAGSGAPGGAGGPGGRGGDGGSGGAAYGAGLYVIHAAAFTIDGASVTSNSAAGGSGGSGGSAGSAGQGGFGGYGSLGGNGGEGLTAGFNQPGGGNGGNGGRGGDGGAYGWGTSGGVGGVAGAGGVAFGGGLYVIGNVTMSSADVSANSASGGSGGGGGHGGSGGASGTSGQAGGGGFGGPGGEGDFNGGNGGSPGANGAVGAGGDSIGPAGVGGDGGDGGDGGAVFGGGAYFSGGVATIHGCSITQDTTTGGAAGYGGAGGDGGQGSSIGQGAGGASGGYGGYGHQGVGGNGTNAAPTGGAPPAGAQSGPGGHGGASGQGGTARGGAVYFDSGTLVLISSNFSSDAALGGQFTNGGPGGNGGVGGYGGGGVTGGTGGTGGQGRDGSGASGQSAPGGLGGPGGDGGPGGNGGAGSPGGFAYGGSLYQNNGSVYIFGGSFANSNATGGGSGNGGPGGAGGDAGVGGNGGIAGPDPQGLAIFGNIGGNAGAGGNGGPGGNGGNTLTPGGAFGGDIDVLGTHNIWITGTTLDGSVQGGNAGLLGAAGGGGAGARGGAAGPGSPNGSPGAHGGDGTAGQAGNANGSGISGDPTVSGGTLLTDTQSPSVSLQATNVTASNAAAQNPYIFSLAFLDDTLVNYQSVLAATVLVQPPTGPALTAQFEGTVESGPSQVDGLNDAASLSAVYEITPPGGSWTAAADGTYSILFSGSPVTDLAGNAVPLGTVATFQVGSPTTTAVSSDHAAGSTYGDLVTFTANVTSAGGTPTGSVQFQLDGENYGAPVTLVNGAATVSTAALTAGSHGIDAIYTADTGLFSNSDDAASPWTQTVKQATPVLTWANPNDLIYGAPLTGVQLDATANVPGAFVYSPATGTVLNAGQNQTLSVVFTPTDTTDYTTAIATASINIDQATPVITWTNPGTITYGTALSATQLDATANVPGTFAYNPATGTVLSAGQNQTLSATFTPIDTLDYKTAAATVRINVNQANPVITWTNPSDITYGTAMSGTQLDATANVPGTFVYSPAAGIVLNAGQGQTLNVTFTPTDTTDYQTTTATATINVAQAVPVITWANPSDVTYGTALSGTQLDATANVPGSFAYSPTAGTVLNAGHGQTLSVTFTPTDTTDYKTTTATTTIDVEQAVPVITWANPSNITYGTGLTGTQLDATANVPGSFAYSPAAGTVLGIGQGQTLSVTFTPADTTDYQTTTATATINVKAGALVITWSYPAEITYGTALSGTQLDATANIPGSFVYSPAAGTVLNAGQGQTLTATFTPTDTTDFQTATVVATINVNQATPVITWANPADITYGTALNGTQLDATANVPGTFAYGPTAGSVLQAGQGQTLSVTFTPTDSTDYRTTTATTTVNVRQAAPVITWANPSDITFGTALSATQLDATASVPGSFVYSPATGTVLNGGQGKTLNVIFTPSDTTDYKTATAIATINVKQAVPIIAWPNSSDITYGTALSGTQLDAAANVPGSFVYSPAAGTVLNAGAGQALTATFTPTDTTDYQTATAMATINVNQATPAVTWLSPSDVTYGTPLSGTQLDATANVPGSFAYTPTAGTVLNAGQQMLSVTFTPTDTSNYRMTTATATIDVKQAVPIITWPNPSDITFGTALSGTQLDATANVPGSFTYTPAAGTVLNAGQGQTLNVTFTPSDTTDYKTTTATATINVKQAVPIIAWPDPNDMTYGTALSGTQLDATTNTPGSFAYSPAAGTVLGAGQGQTLSVTFTPADTTDLETVTAMATINVKQAMPVITWAKPSDITYGTALSGTQLDATANVPGTFAYSPASGTVLDAGQGETLKVTFVPTDGADYTSAVGNVLLNVEKATPTVSAVDNGGPFTGQPSSASAAATGVGGTSVQGSFSFTYKDAQNNPLPDAPSSVGGYSVVATFTSADPNYNGGVSLPAVSFAISSGPAGAIGTDMPAFAWSPVAGAKHYALKVTDGKTVVLNLANIPGTTYTLPSSQALTPGQSYSWSVTSVDAKGKAIGSSSNLAFQVLPLGAPAPVGPTGSITTDRPAFVWNAAADASHTPANDFTLTVTDTSNKHVLTIANLTGTSYTLTTAQALTPGDSFTWSVTAVSTNGKATANGQSAAFTLAPLTAPVLLPFASASETFSWQGVTDAGHYSLKVLDSVTGAVAVTVPGVAGTTYQLTSKQTKALKHGRSYTWYVTAVSTNGKASVRSTGATFTM